MTHTALEKKLADIPEEYLDDVSAYLDYIHYLAASRAGKLKGTGCRRPGVLKGSFWMADDFDAPLDDFREYM
jgi:hypothetical protein